MKFMKYGYEHSSTYVIHPNTLSEAVNVLQACSNANVAVIPMGKNTSLTG